jgi:hypothetical protein
MPFSTQSGPARAAHVRDARQENGASDLELPPSSPELPPSSPAARPVHMKSRADTLSCDFRPSARPASLVVAHRKLKSTEHALVGAVDHRLTSSLAVLPPSGQATDQDGDDRIDHVLVHELLEQVDR